jgi:hypothetical protein
MERLHEKHCLEQPYCLAKLQDSPVPGATGPSGHFSAILKEISRGVFIYVMIK